MDGTLLTIAKNTLQNKRKRITSHQGTS